MSEPQKMLWKMLWDYDPNGLVVVDLDLNITIVNEAFCAMFGQDRKALMGQKAFHVLGDMSDFRYVWEHDSIIRAKEMHFPRHDLYVRQVIFPIREEKIIACIMVDVTQEWKQKEGFLRLKAETLEKLNQVVDRQMRAAQEIAGLLGETTAETKVTLVKLVETLRRDNR